MSRQIPNHLKHKPIYVLENYSTIDGHYKNDTDVIGLSLGKAQWCDNELIPSVKVWRKKNNRWSRQSEETTLTRALDLATLIIKVLDAIENGGDIEDIHTIFGSLSISEVDENADLKRELIEYLTAHNQKNLNDIQAHIDVLHNALAKYKNIQR